MALGEKRIEQIASRLVNEQDGTDDYRIVLSNGQTISQSEINIKNYVNMKQFGKSVDKDEAWVALVENFKNLVDNGTVEQ